MSVNRRHESWSWPRRATLAAALLLSILTIPLGLAAQVPPQFVLQNGCMAPPPPPDNDAYPLAVTDALQTSSAPLSFTAATLLANDRGTSLTVTSVAASSSAGGHVTGANPYTYTPPAGFTGIDTFSYTIQNTLGSAVG